MTPEDYVFKTKPMCHQHDVFLDSADKEYWAFFLEPGLGKSKCLIDNIGYLYEAGKIAGAVISTIKAMLPTFELIEIPTHMPDRINYRVFRYDSARVSTKAFKEKFQEFLKFPGLKIFVYNTEASISEKLADCMREFYKAVRGSYLFGLDESSMIKSPDAQRTKATIKFSRAAKYRRIMTGTPISSSPMNLFSQASALGDPLKLLGHKSFYSFRGYYAIVEKKVFGNRSFDVVTGHQNTEKLSELMSAFSHIMKKEDCLDLPEKVYSRVVVEMTPEQNKMYQTLREQAIIELEGLGETIEVTNILTLLVKLHQIVCGQLKYTDDFGKEIYTTIPNNRVPTLMDLVSMEEGKVVIWANYKQTIRDIVEQLAKEYGPESVIEFHGSVPDNLKEVAAKRFQDKNDPSRFFVANQQSGGMGLTLTESDLAIYFSNSYSLERRIQSEDRIHRISQLRSARYIDLVTPGTVDIKILDALRKAQNMVDKIVISNWRGLFE